VVNAMLEQMNCKVTAVENGVRALDACKRERFDLIMMDCEMPVMSGHAAALQIREWERSEGRNEVPIVALTANVTIANKQRCFDAGMNVFLTKPVSQARLSLALAQALRNVSRPQVA
jgi:CheY-like chemotaxis protein